MKKKTKKKVEELIELDPIFPIPLVAGSLPVVRQGDGGNILRDTKPVVIEVPYRAFFMAWELIEKRAAEQYPRYANGSLDHLAQTYLESVVGFRNAALRSTMQDVVLAPVPESEAAIIRDRWRKAQEKAWRKTQEKAKRPKKGSEAADESKPAQNGSAGKKTGSRGKSEDDLCGEKHKIDGKVRKCRRKPDHAGKHKDKLGNRW